MTSATAKYLLDTSAIYPLTLKLREKLLLYRDLFAVLDLTIYEVGNAVWREYRRGKIVNILPVVKLFEEVLKNLEKLSVGGVLHEILEVAVKSNITVYDASYIYVARRHGLKLVTEDKDLLKLPESISVGEMLKELNL